MRCVSRSVARAMRGQRVVLGSLTFYRLSLHSERSDAARPVIGLKEMARFMAWPKPDRDWPNLFDLFS